MSWTSLSNKKVKIKKERVCHGCNIKYPVGTEMVKSAGVNDGDFCSIYWCLICEEFLADKWSDLEEGIGKGDVWEYDEYQKFRKEKVDNGAPNGTWPEYLIKWKGDNIKE